MKLLSGQGRPHQLFLAATRDTGLPDDGIPLHSLVVTDGRTDGRTDLP